MAPPASMPQPRLARAALGCFEKQQQQVIAPTLHLDGRDVAWTAAAVATFELLALVDSTSLQVTLSACKQMCSNCAKIRSLLSEPHGKRCSIARQCSCCMKHSFVGRDCIAALPPWRIAICCICSQ